MSQHKKKDALLIVAKTATVIVRIAIAIGMVGIGIGMAALAAGGAGYLPDEVRVEFGSALEGGAIWILIAAMFGALIALALSYDFTSRLAQIIDTVGQGDPFIMDNAARLQRMAWLALGVQIVSIPASLLSSWAETHLEQGAIEVRSDVSLTGFGLVLVLFILARVFREGARMREELEGTV